MVTLSVARRMRKLRASLLNLRIGPAAAILSPNVKRINLNFAFKIDDGHMGPRKFWRNHLPQLKYHNPSIPMTVERTADNKGPATLTVFFAPPTSNSPSPAPTSSTSGDKPVSDHEPFDETRTIDMKHKKEDEILASLLRICKAERILPTPEEEQQLREMEEEARRAAQDRAATLQIVAKQKREKEILQNARKSMDTV